GRHAVQRKVKLVQGDVVERFRERGPGTGIEVCPEPVTPSTAFLPQPRLGLVHADRGGLPHRSAVMLGVQSLLVERVPDLMKSGEETTGEVSRLEPHGEAAVASAQADAAGVDSQVHTPPA